MRDALSILDQCISFYLGKKLTYDNVLEVLGAVDTSVFAKLLGCILKQEVSSCIKLLEEIESSGRELGQFTIDFIWYLRNLLLIKTTEDIADMVIEISTENLALLQQEAATLDEMTLIRYIRVFSELSNQIRYATRKRVLIEIALIKLCKPEMEANLDSVLDRIKILEDKLAKGMVATQVGPGSHYDAAKDQPVNKQPVILPEAVPEDLKQVVNNWKSIVGQIAKKAPAMASILQDVKLSIDGNKGLQLVVIENLDKDMIERETHLQVIKDVIAQMIHKQVQVSVRLLDKNKERIEEVVDLSKLVKMPIQYE
jgi:DNA polymerase-3 subunit gamma/tau